MPPYQDREAGTHGRKPYRKGEKKRSTMPAVPHMRSSAMVAKQLTILWPAPGLTCRKSLMK